MWNCSEPNRFPCTAFFLRDERAKIVNEGILKKINELMGNFRRKRLDFSNHFEFGALVDHHGEMWSDNEAAQRDL